ncbi:hypothetical protein BCD48_44465 [Pseudofrankia sp. BMG5.36]|nr:hypothetical protein BCD48_44465 [Pseudofrankia sp. BMG5.36]
MVVTRRRAGNGRTRPVGVGAPPRRRDGPRYRATVYRHFPTERELHDAIMQRIEDEAGVSYDDLDLEGLNPLVVRAFAHMATFAARPGADQDPAAPGFVADRRRRDALLRAVTPVTAEWSDTQRLMVVAILDILWDRNTQDRLVNVWKLDPDQATQAVTWSIGHLVDMIRRDERPGPKLGTPPS